MGITPFNKPALSGQDLLAKLINQGLWIGNQTSALTCLQHVGAFRLKGYWYYLLDPATKRFPSGLTFQDIIKRYEFDRELRALAFKVVERLEIAIRATMSNHLALKHGTHWYLKPDVFKPTSKWSYGTLLKKIEDEVKRAQNRPYIKHYYKKHDEPYIPPSWAITECVTFGFWSQTYPILADPNDRKAISKKFGVNVHEVFQSWLHAIAYMRNVIAHHDRLLRFKPVISPANYAQAAIRFPDTQSFYAFATVSHYLVTQAGLHCTWKQDLIKLFADYPTVPISELDFPSNWEALPGW